MITESMIYKQALLKQIEIEERCQLDSSRHDIVCHVGEALGFMLFNPVGGGMSRDLDPIYDILFHLLKTEYITHRIDDSYNEDVWTLTAKGRRWLRLWKSKHGSSNWRNTTDRNLEKLANFMQYQMGRGQNDQRCAAEKVSNGD